MKKMVESLITVVLDIQGVTEQVAAGSEELAASSESLSQGASQQVAAVEQVAASMKDMLKSIHHNAEQARNTERLAQKSLQATQSSSEALQQTVSMMHRITSYNVCYTKLLRAFRVARHVMQHQQHQPPGVRFPYQNKTRGHLGCQIEGRVDGLVQYARGLITSMSYNFV